MEVEKKYALLDTDFLYKSHLARNEINHTLTELIIEFEDYSFYCHEMIKDELTKRVITPDPNPWLEGKIAAGAVCLYSDRDIVQELEKVYGNSATVAYITLLKTSCDTFNKEFYDEYYSSLEAMDDMMDIEKFLFQLKVCDEKIPPKQGLGEKKTYVLIQMMEIIYGREVYVFCSDDFKARQNIAGLSKPINCISILGVFYKLMKIGYDKGEMKVYYDSLSNFLKHQTEYKVWSFSGNHRIGVPMEQVFDDIYDGKFQLLRNGDLQYIND